MFFSMRVAPILILLTMAEMAASAADTAYTALRILGKSKGEQTLDRVVELRGRNGAPEPAVWKVVLSEPSARGGIREYDVQRGRIVGERAPSAPRVAPGAPMNFTQLNLDSEGAFTVANQEMQKAKVPFDRVEYTLRSGGRGGAPVWRLELFDGATRSATMEIAADTGAVVERNLRSGGGPIERELPPRDREYADDREYLADRRPNVERGYSRPGEPFRGVDDFFHRMGKRVERRSRQVENFFTGRGGSREVAPDEERD